MRRASARRIVCLPDAAFGRRSRFCGSRFRRADSTPTPRIGIAPPAGYARGKRLRQAVIPAEAGIQGLIAA